MENIILNIETATKNCSVSLSKNGMFLDIIEYVGEGYSHAEKLHVFIDKILKNNHIATTDLSAIAVSKGPGSYTGLRIGVSAAKGLAYSLQIPLISVSTLVSMAQQIQQPDVVIIPLIDARRMEVYSLVYLNNQIIRQVQADILDEHSYKTYLDNHKVVFIGDGVAKTKEIIKHKNAIFSDIKYPSAKEMIKLSYQKWIENNFEDVAYFEPFYLKDFITTAKRKKYF